MATRPTQLRFWTIALAALTGLTVGIVRPVHPADFVVNSTDDHLDGTCDAADCSLRDAVWVANLDPGADLIGLPAGNFVLDIPGTDEDGCLTGDIDILSAMIIVGMGADATIIDAGALGDRVLHVNAPGESVGLANLTVTGGDAGGVRVDPFGGGILQSDGTLVLSGVNVTGNTAAEGGGIHVRSGDLTVQDGSLIAGNICVGGGGAGIATALWASYVTIIDSTISDNHGEYGGGLLFWMTDATVSRSTISYNSADSTLGGGGGILVFEPPNAVNIGNSTIFGNSAVEDGGAIFIGYSSITNLASVTIAENTSADGSSITVQGQLNMVNTIIAGSCEPIGTIASGGGNLESPSDTCGLVHALDLVDVPDPMIMGLGDFGGPTATVLPLLGSPVIDNGNHAFCGAIDQRSFDRSDGACDIGAVERQPEDVDPVFFDGFETGDTSRWSG